MGVPSGGLVAVHAHPDDETLATGALLATWAAAGRPVMVVTGTRGERGEVIGAALAHLQGDGPALARHRETELAAALAALGVREHAFLDTLPGWTGGRLEDSGMAWADEGRRAVAAPDAVAAGTAFAAQELDALAAPLAQLLVVRRPDVVVTYEPRGGYGHPDHVRAHDVTQRAVELARAASVDVPVVLWAAQGRSAAGAARAALRRRGRADGSGATLPADDDVFASVVVDDEHVAVAVDTRAVRDAVLAALRAHATQVQHVAAVDDEPALAGTYALSLGLSEPILPVEQYRLATGTSEGALDALVRPAGVTRVA
ncbi:PIG-L family deacetylase [Cellulomonas sp. DKR-3]|uniref:PIG-L family deacetylase n=1 Tax=Cellulomonas fulva TaxID=2835530 RepID=A0ABS5TUI6_9CELL|nr:PIG-L family deacetylase [Cellulomonas fulva]MBT0992803.1 PIG-L family deacetylase [Cellulomonas fulva]